MQAPEYRFLDRWFVPTDIDWVYDLLGTPRRYPEWWSAAFPEAEGPDGPPEPGKRSRVVSRGFLPYKLRWTIECVEVDRPHRIHSVLSGDFEGTGTWTFTSRDDGTQAVLDFRPRVNKPGVKQLTPILRPLFQANHRWAMRRGQEGILRLAAARSGEPAQAGP